MKNGFLLKSTSAKPYFALIEKQIWFLSEVVQKCPVGPKRVPKCQRHLGLPFLTLLDQGWTGKLFFSRGGGAKSSLLPLTSLCVSSPTHTCSPHWISFPFSNRKKPVLIFTFSIFARSLRKKIQVFLVMRCWSEWKDWSSRAHNLIYIIYNLISWLTRKQQNIYSTALGIRAELFVNWGKMHKITHSHSRGSLLSLSWSK